LPGNRKPVEMEIAGSPRELEEKPKFPNILEQSPANISVRRVDRCIKFPFNI
jgi:hypothetical protein